jgi:hypothetical protein
MNQVVPSEETAPPAPVEWKRHLRQVCHSEA